MAEFDNEAVADQAQLFDAFLGNVEPQRTEAIHVKHLADNVVALASAFAEWCGDKRSDLDSIPQLVWGDPACERGSGWREYVSGVKRRSWARRCRSEVCEGVRLDNASAPCCRRKQDAIVRPDKARPASRHETHVSPRTPDSGIDYYQVYGIGELVGSGGGNCRALSNVVRLDTVSEIRDVSLGTLRMNDRMAHADPRVVQTKVGDEADDGAHEPYPCLEVCGQTAPWTTMVVPDLRRFAVGRMARTSLILAAAAMSSALLLSGCTPTGPTWVERGGNYDKTTALTKLARVDAGPVANQPTASGPKLRHGALVSLRRHGSAASGAADLITKAFPSSSSGVPLYVEQGSFGGQPATILVEAIGPAAGSLDSKRIWVIAPNGNILFAGSR